MDKILFSYEDLKEMGFGSRATIWRRLKDDSLKFPKPIDIGYGQKRWRDTDLHKWIKQRTAATRADG